MFERIAAYLAKQLEVPVESITEDTTFDSLGFDSLDAVEMLMDLEEELNVELEVDGKLNTVGEFAKFVEEHVG